MNILKTIAVALVVSFVAATPHWADAFIEALDTYDVLPAEHPLLDDSVTFANVEYLLARMFAREAQDVHDAPLTRLDGILWMVNVFHLPNGNPKILEIFPDYYLIPTEHREAVAAAVAAGIVRGHYETYDVLTLSPFATMTYGQAASFLMNGAGTIVSESESVMTGEIQSNVLVTSDTVLFENANISGQVLIPENPSGRFIFFEHTSAKRLITHVHGDLIILDSDIPHVEIHPTGALNMTAQNNAPNTVYITDGMGEVQLWGYYANIVINTSVPVTIIGGTVDRVTIIAENANVTIGMDVAVQLFEIAETANGFVLQVDGVVDSLIAESEYGHVFGIGQIYSKIIGKGHMVELTTPAVDIPLPSPTPRPIQLALEADSLEDESSAFLTPTPTPQSTPLPTPDPTPTPTPVPSPTPTPSPIPTPPPTPSSTPEPTPAPEPTPTPIPTPPPIIIPPQLDNVFSNLMNNGELIEGVYVETDADGNIAAIIIENGNPISINIDDDFIDSGTPLDIRLGSSANMSLDMSNVTPPLPIVSPYVDLGGITITGERGSVFNVSNFPSAVRISVGGSVTIDASGATNELFIKLNDSISEYVTLALPPGTGMSPVFLEFPVGESSILVMADIIHPQGIIVNSARGYGEPGHVLQLSIPVAAMTLQFFEDANVRDVTTALRTLGVSHTGGGQPRIEISHNRMDIYYLHFVHIGGWQSDLVVFH
ncbi:MAG: hypothetical protein FWE05_00245 [Defluviitaleaceae bacterium]|nr:hypothetical protein [Defluviitaleaceae bacterium]